MARGIGAGRRRVRLGLWGAALALVPALAAAVQPDDFEAPPVRYSATPATDTVAQLQARIDRGEVRLARSDHHGYLESVLSALRIPVSSQLLVFSKTSFQRERISPRSPRAIYFNDQAYVGWVKGGPVLEISTVDPQLGAVFYLLDQDAAGKPRFARQSYECLSCHNSSLTKGVPGHVVRSVYPGRDGLPLLAAGTFLTTDASPLEQRWGGWYVTGTHGEQRHMGNLTVKDTEQAADLDRDPGANVTDLRRYFDARPYLARHSDLVALLVLEHQAQVQNLITRANYETRRALAYEEALNKELGAPAGSHRDSTLSRIRSVAEPLTRALLFSGAAPLSSPVAGTAGFAAEFAKEGPRDPQGRSLREFDLKRRLFRYPCSYLLYSDAFAALPAPAKEYVYRRLREVLSGGDQSAEFAHLSLADRRAVREILTATHREFAASG
jgi:hypothetical protein